MNFRKCVQFLRKWSLNMLREILAIIARIHLIDSQRVTKQS